MTSEEALAKAINILENRYYSDAEGQHFALKAQGWIQLADHLYRKEQDAAKKEYAI